VRKSRVATGIAAVSLLALAYPPVMDISTYVFGEKARAQVAECHEERSRPSRFGGGTTTSCSGTWTTSGGERGSGHIADTGREDVGRTIEVRVGRSGAAAGGLLSRPTFVVFGSIWVFLLVAVPAIALWAVGTVLRSGRRLVSEAPAGATLLRTSRGRVLDTDGTVLCALRDDGEGRVTAGGLAMHRRPGPEIRVTDPPVVIRRAHRDPPSYTVTDADGETRWEIRSASGRGHGVLAVRDQAGREAALLAQSWRGMIVRVEPGASAPVRDIGLAFALNHHHLHR
jgi:hypothetical protein